MDLDLVKEKIKTAKVLISVGNFSEELFDIVISQPDSIKNLIEKNESLPDTIKEQTIYYKALSLVAEVLIYQNKFKSSTDFWFTHGANALFSLKHMETDSITLRNQCFLHSEQPHELSDHEKDIIELFKAKILLIIHYLDADPYREGKYLMVEDTVSRCKKIIENIHHKEYSPCFGTLASLSYAYGCVLRQLYKYKNAERAFGESIEYAYERLQLKMKVQVNKIDLENEKKMASYRVARVLSLGFGFILMKQGYLRRAESCVLTSRILFEQAKDTVYSTFAKLIYACILRSKSGYDLEKLDRVINNLKECIETFKQYDHAKYQLRAEYELGVCLIQYLEAFTKPPYGKEGKKFSIKELKKFSDAENLLTNVCSIASKTSNKRWVGNSKVALSHLHRLAGIFKHIEATNNTYEDEDLRQKEFSSYSKALEFAENAIDVVQEPEQKSCLISAYVAKGEVLIKLSRLNDARIAFESALNKSKENNPRKMAICHITLALISFKQGFYSQAKEHLEQGKYLVEEIEDSIIRNRISEVEQEIANKSQILIINPEESLDYEFHEKKLREFLLKQAEQRGKSLTALSEMLGISRPTLHKWMSTKSTLVTRKSNI